eukprot:g20847.t1
MNDPVKVADLAAGLSTADRSELQGVLEEQDLKRKIEKVTVLLQRDLSMVKMQSEVKSKVEEKVLKEQKQKILMDRTNQTSRTYLEWLTCLPWGEFTAENRDIKHAETEPLAEHLAFHESNTQAVQLLQKSLRGETEMAEIQALRATVRILGTLAGDATGDTVPDVSSSGSPLAQALRCEGLTGAVLELLQRWKSPKEERPWLLLEGLRSKVIKVQC